MIVPFRSYLFSRLKSRRGVALVVTLVLLVLMVGLGVAFLSKVLLDRGIRDGSASRQQAAMFARSAMGIIEADFIQEIAAGSFPDAMPGVHVAFFEPRREDTDLSLLGASDVKLSTAPSMVLQRQISSILKDSHPSLVKESRSGLPTFSPTDGYVLTGVGTPSYRASGISTTAAGSQTRGLSGHYWEKPFLSTNNTTPANNVAPDWVYMDRSGTTPDPASDLALRTNRDAENEGFVIGRFAYRVYDVGGLLDLNVLGTAGRPEGKSLRASLEDVAIDSPPAGMGISGTGWEQMVNWRNGTQKPFLSRQDMLRVIQKQGWIDQNAIDQGALRWFSVGGRVWGGPGYATEPNLLAVTPSDLDAELLNPPLGKIRFATETTLNRGSEGSLTVPSGTSVMPRKFPLKKIDLLANSSANANDLFYYFGLERQSDGSFRYVAADGTGVIKDLATVANEGREPNFFEVLQAVIATGSMGRNAGNSFTVNQQRDGLRTLQTLRIGANIIDQWDTDDYPTVIRYFVPATGEWEPAYGVENLPCFNTITMIGYRPDWNDYKFQLWALFDVWNPHQNAGTSPAGITGFRIKARSGAMDVSLQYYIQDAGSYTDEDGNEVAAPKGLMTGTLWRPKTQDVAELNAGRFVEFSSALHASVPVAVGAAGPPDGLGWNGGLLLFNGEDEPPAVPAKIEDHISENQPLVNSLNIYLTAAGMTKIGEVDGKGNKGTFGAKTHNYFRLRSTQTDKLIFDLQYQKSGGDWVTYQSVKGFLPIISDPAPLTGGQGGSPTVVSSDQVKTVWMDNTLASAGTVVDMSADFYAWRINGEQPSMTSDYQATGLSMGNYDPRSERFGHSYLNYTQRMRTIRQSVSSPVYPSSSNDRVLLKNWMVMYSGKITSTVTGSYTSGMQLIYTLQPVDAIQASLLSSSGSSGGTSFNWDGTGDMSASAYFMPFGYIANIPEAPLSTTLNPSRYRDRDGVIRPGDGYLGAVPTSFPIVGGNARGGLGDRPVILNRPFQSVGEMGYAFRDEPWKTLDFFTRNSADLGLLDAFSIDPIEGDIPIVKGKVNINSAPKEVLAVLMQGSGRLTTEGGSDVLSAADADSLAQEIVTEREKNGPFMTVGDVVSRVFSPTANKVAGTNFDPKNDRKTEREAAIRALSAVAETRTWNLLIDLVVQPGFLLPNATQASQFYAKAERRYWVHLSLDRLTGEILNERWEPVYE